MLAGLLHTSEKQSNIQSSLFMFGFVCVTAVCLSA